MLTQERLKEVLWYDPVVGVWIRKVRTSQNMRVGDFAGCVSKQGGYQLIGIDGKQYQAHKLAILYVDGYLPEEVDHKDRNRANNAYSNLRVVTRTQNNGNMGLSAHNSSGYKGVCKAKNGYWRAYIKIGDGRQKSLGTTFREAEQAALAYDHAAREYFGEFARLNFPKEGEAGV